MAFSVLGPLRYQVEGAPVPISAAKVRTMLALLLARANRPVSLRILIDEIWDDHPPRSAVANIRTYVLCLRRLLPPDRLVATHCGYQLVVRPGELDLHRYLELVGQARRQVARDDFDGAARRLERALAAWHGTPFDLVPAGPALTMERDALVEGHLAVIELAGESLLAAGALGPAVGLLRRHAAGNPLREAAQELLMRALHHSGDTAAALAVFAATRRTLVTELGLEPGPGLQRTHRAVLAGAVHRPAAPPTRVSGAVAAPRELPPRRSSLFGRGAELALIDQRLGGAEPGVAHAVAIHGPTGSGTSALAICAAHQVSDRYPDGQVYIDLAGGRRPMAALTRALRALGTSAAHCPSDPEEASTLLRASLSGRRVLFVVDHVADSADVEPLLSADGHCGLLIAGRPMLATLDGVTHVGLGPLSRVDAVTLLERASGRHLDPEPAAQVVELCDRLPLAVRIAAARLASRPDVPADWLVQRLADERRRLDELTFGAAAVRPRIHAAYQALGRRGDDRFAALLYRRLGRHATTEVTVDASTVLVGRGLRRCDQRIAAALDRLAHVRLLQGSGPDRYRMSGLVRLHARELSTR